MSPLISVDDLSKLLLTNIILIDARSGPDARQRYEKEHLKGALLVDLDHQLADVKPNPADGGRHPLPTPEAFSKVLAAFGITHDSHVIVYDDKNGANAAARFWWMMRAAGHSKIQVVNGGLNAITRGGLPLTSGQETPDQPGQYSFKNWKSPLVTMEEVAAATQDANKKIIDVREKERFDGIRESIDLVAGHIPNAINVFFATNLDADGLYLPAAELKEKYMKAFDGVSPENIIVHCGSGVTACHTLLAMAYAGIETPSLYVGSWSEWSRNH